MTETPYGDDQVAGGLIRRGTARLADAHPLHAGVLEQFRIVPDASVGTMGVGLLENQLVLLYNPTFVLALPADQLCGALLHEVLHVVYGHVIADPSDLPDRLARTIAEEVAVNEYIREPLPDGVIRLEDFAELRAGQSTRERYQILVGRAPQRLGRVSRPAENGQPTTGEGPPTSAWRPSCGPEEEQQYVVSSRYGQSESTAGAPEVRCPASPSGMLDTHDRWPSAIEERDQCREQFADMIATAAVTVPAELIDALKHAGLTCGADAYRVTGAGFSSVSWRPVW